MSYVHIVAVCNNGVIGVNDKLPVHVPEDLVYFKQLTMSAPVVIGYNTYQSIKNNYPSKDGTFLKDRKVFVLRTETEKVEEFNSNLEFDNVLACHSLMLANISSNTKPYFIAGGSTLYEYYSLPSAIFLTEIDYDVDVQEGDKVHTYPLYPSLSTLYRCIEGVWQTSSTGIRYRFNQYLKV